MLFSDQPHIAFVIRSAVDVMNNSVGSGRQPLLISKQPAVPLSGG